MRKRALIAALALATAGIVAGPGATVADAEEPTNPLTPTDVTGMTAWDGWVYFAARTDDVGAELWRSRDDVIELVADVNPGTAGSSVPDAADSNPYFFTPFGDWLYFRAENEATGTELWRTDGVTTELAADINPGADDSWPSELVVFDGNLYFSAYTPASTFALWRFDGSTPEMVSGTDRWAPGEFIVFDGWLYASAFGTGAEGLFRTDGVVVESVSPVSATSPEVLGEWIYFDGDTPEHGSELWRTNGTVTELVADINQGPGWSRPEDLEVLGDWLYFRAETEESGAELWRTNGAVTELVADINAGARSSEPDDLEAAGDWIYFGALYSYLWRTDGVAIERIAAPDAHVFSQYLDVGDPEVTGWTSTVYVPSATGSHTFVLEWMWGDDVRIDVRDAATGRWIAADTSDAAPKFLTVGLTAGVEYRIAVWIQQASTFFTASVIEPEPEPEPPGEVVFVGSVDATSATAPRWVSTTLVPATSGELTLTLDWVGSADVRFDVRVAATGAWVAAATSGPAPRSATVDLDAGVAYRLAVWSTSGAADFEVTTSGSGPPPPTGEVVFAGSVDATSATVPRWVSTTLVPTVSGAHLLSLDWVGVADVRFDVRVAATGAWVAAATSGPAPRSATVDLDAGVVYRLAVWSTSGTADFEVTLTTPGG